MSIVQQRARLRLDSKEVQAHKEQKSSMKDVTKHDPEEEGECNRCENSRIDFFVKGNAVGIDDLLEGPHEIRCLY